MRSYIASLVVLAGLVAPPGASARPLDDVVSSKVLRVVVYEDNRPFSWLDGGEPKGIDVELGKALARKLNVDPEIIVRVAGEDVDDDLRSNVWQGPRTGGLVGDVMLHVPIDKELMVRNSLIAFANPYYQERIVLAVHPDLVGPDEGFSAFKTRKVAVQFATAAHYFIAFAEDGALKANVNPYVKFGSAAESFLDRTNAGLLGPRSQVEAALRPRLGEFRVEEPPMPGILRTNWTVGTAVKEDSRDLSYAIGKAMRELVEAGTMKDMFAAYGVDYREPPVR